jgi:uncharacterized protein (TIGR03032 family)
MISEEEDFEKLKEIQNKALRDPYQVICGTYELHGIVPRSFEYKMQGRFSELLEKLNITLLVTREYEHLMVAMNVKKGRLNQSFLHLPHPNGIAVNRKTNKVYVASTRSPSQIVELSLVNKLMNRDGHVSTAGEEKLFVPARVKYYAGAYYFHDLAIIGDKLYANSVGKNGVIEINMSSAASEKVVWSPLPEKMQNANHLQLNSIAAGKTLASSYFSASAEKPGEYKPGDLRFPVDKKGVIFSGKTKKPVARNLTRPHSAKLYKNKLWINNSGYGEFGYIKNGVLQVCMKFAGWTRGLCFLDNIAFVGVSKIIPKFRVYAPGIKGDRQECSIYAVDIKKREIIGAIEWPFGNQVYGIEWIDAKKCGGFPFTNPGPSTESEKDYFFRHII